MSEGLPLPNQQQEDKDIKEAGEEKESGSHVLHSNLYGNNPSGASEDELVSWLQYPLDDAFDRGYCSDILRHWPASPLATTTTTTACNPDPSQDASALVAMASSSCGGMKLLPQAEEGLAISIEQRDSTLAAGAALYDHQYSQRLSQDEGVRVDELEWCKQAQQDEGRMYKDVDARRTARQLKHWHYQERQEGRCMNTELHRRVTYTQSEAVHTIPAAAIAAKSSSEAALALGASRAAGLVRQAGVEAFNKVRTALQPTVRRISPFSLMPPSNVYQKYANCSPMNPTMLPPRIQTFGSYGSVLPSSPIGGSLKLPIPPYPHLPKHPINVRACEGQYTDKKKQGSVSHKLSPNMGRGSGASSDKSLESSTTSVMEQKSIEQGFVAIYASGSDATTTTTATTSTSSTSMISGAGRALPKLAPCASSIPSSVKKYDGLIDVHSGGSQTSESLKGAISTGKRKMEVDSEAFSEDAEGESADVNSSQLARPKRSRAAETHNASERRRRERINEKLRALGELIPNSSKTDKASLLDEAIEYLKMLQLHLQVMSMRSGVTLSPMMLPSSLTHLPIPELGAGHPPSAQIMQGGPAASGPAGGGLNIAGSMSYGVNPATSSANPLIISTTNHAHVPNILAAPTSTSAAAPGLISHFQAAAPTSMSVSTAVEAQSIFFPRPSPFQVTSQPFPSVNMEMYNSYLQRRPPHEHMQQLVMHEQQQQQLQHDQQLRRTHEDRHPQQQ